MSTQVRFGVYGQNMYRVVGCTVDYIRQRLTVSWGIPRDAVAYIGSTPVPDYYTIRPGDSVEFHRPFQDARLPPHFQAEFVAVMTVTMNELLKSMIVVECSHDM